MPRIVDETITVSEGDAERDTGIIVQPGQRVVIRADGSIWAGVWFTGNNGPQGWNNRVADWKFPLQGAPSYCLIGRFNDNWFEVGRAYEQLYQPGPSGAASLTLMVNDDVHGNGDGAFRAQVEIWQD
jgi:hypothetical protein